MAAATRTQAWRPGHCASAPLDLIVHSVAGAALNTCIQQCMMHDSWQCWVCDCPHSAFCKQPKTRPKKVLTWVRLQYATSSDVDFMPHAIKFFLKSEDFAVEDRLYQNSQIRHTLPELVHSSDNASGIVRSRSGMSFPPFMIMERGSPLAECVCQHHEFVRPAQRVLASKAGAALRHATVHVWKC